MSIVKSFRQGDLLFTKASSVPKGKVRKNGHILEGEATGHIHRVGVLADAEVVECGEELYLRVTAEGGVSIMHEDHAALTIPKGNWRIERQREYSPEEIRNVAD